MTLEQLKSEAREKLKKCLHHTGMYMLSQDQINTLITTAYNAGLERAVEVVGSIEVTSYDEKNLCTEEADAYKLALDDIKAKLQAEVTKDNK